MKKSNSRRKQLNKQKEMVLLNNKVHHYLTLPARKVIKKSRAKSDAASKANLRAIHDFQQIQQQVSGSKDLAFKS